jgi:hypothetical protein
VPHPWARTRLGRVGDSIPNMTQRPPWTTLLTYLLGFLPICLLWHGNNAFYFDWNNHLWGIGYFGEYFRRHWAFPVTLNTEQAAGIPYPVFYGYLFYPAAGLISAFTGCSFALRFVCSLVFLFQVRQVNKAVESISGNRFVACAVTVLVSFATYPLTNLYNRAAISEFIAVSLVVSVCMMWLRLVRMTDPLQRRRLVFGAALAMAFAMGTHPITAILGGCMVGFAMLASLPFPRSLWKPLGWAGVLLSLVMAPWIYAAAIYGRKVQISSEFIGFFPNTIDRFITRFSPLPWDPRLGTEEFRIWRTPYLDTQINFALLLLAVFLFFRIAGRGQPKALPHEFYAALAAFAGFALVCVMSMSPQPWRLIPHSLHFIQFAYRMVTYADLFLLFAVLFLLAGMRRVAALQGRPLRVVLTVCLALSTASVTIKLLHALHVEEPNALAGSGWPTTNRDALRSLPSTFYGVAGYAVTIGSRGILANAANPSPVSFPIGTQQHFGEVLPVEIPAGTGRLRTNIQIFPWNRIVWNGREIPFEETSTDLDFLTIVDRNAEAGTLEYVLRPDPVWMVLRALSLWTAILWALGLCLANYRTRNRKGSESTSPGFRT